MTLSNTLSSYTRATFREHLENIYGCKYVGQAFPRPYADPDDMPDQFRPPKGDVFNVPQPTAAGGKYFQWIIDEVIDENKLEVMNAAYVLKDNKKDVSNE